ncbi:MAG: hypothetical protein IJ466_10050 [Clostridia bacterium]|nr:hypothetical protein [Clostridia bacterium]
MVQTDYEALERYLNRIRPVYFQLFNLAHAVTGNCESAEYALQCAMLECWSADEDAAAGHGFREALRRAAIRAALKCSGGEYDWAGLPEPDGEGEELRRMIAQEPAELQRVLALWGGCRLSPGKIAKLCDTDARRVKALLRRFELKVKRKLPAPGRTDRRIGRAVRASLAAPSGNEPDMGSVFRSFQADAAGKLRPSRLPARVLKIVVSAVLAILCIAAFWFAAVLLQPPVLEEPVETGQNISMQK